MKSPEQTKASLKFSIEALSVALSCSLEEAFDIIQGGLAYKYKGN